MAAPRLKKVASLKELEAATEDYVIQGYEVITQGDKSVLLRKKNWGSPGGHVIVGLLTVWWTIGLGNVAYAAYAHSSAEQILLRIDPPAAV